MFPRIQGYPYLAYDTETTGLDVLGADKVFGFSISLPGGGDFYFDIRTNPRAVEWINDEFDRFPGIIVCHNLSFDYKASTNTGIKIPLSKCVDTVVLACLINEHEISYSLDNLSKRYLSIGNQKQGDELYKEMAKIFGGRATKNVQMRNISSAPEHLVAEYAKADTRATLNLYEWQQKEIERQGLQSIVEFEQKLTPVLIANEMAGIRVDVAAAETSVVALTGEIHTLQKQLDGVAGFHCNPQPSKDMQRLFEPVYRNGRWWANDGTPLEMTNSGKPSIGADALRTMKHPAASIILQLRSLIKTRDTFLVGHVLESANNGRIYPNINQTKGDDGGTGTGRLSYTAPAMQQIPDRRKDIAAIIKPVFLPEEGHVWVDADMASFEVRIFAHLVGTPDIVNAYADNPETDFHQFVADLTGLPRNASYNGEPNAKQLNLSMIFNQGNGTTAETMDMPWSWESFYPKGSSEEVVYKKAGDEAMAVINTYHAHMPGVKRLADGCKKTAESRGYIFTRRGRHLRFPRGYKSYKASGLLIQATAADENKQNWLIVDEALRDTGGRMVLNTHDSYSMSLPEDDAERLARKVKEMVERDRGLRVPLILEVNRPGINWWDSKSKKRWM